jgi:predicted HTH transcriptional regulator
MTVIMTVFGDRDDDRDQAPAAARSEGSGDQRRARFLDAVGSSGRRVAAAEIVERRGVSEKTARRDIAVLMASGLIGFVGTRRSGRYRSSHG